MNKKGTTKAAHVESDFHVRLALPLSCFSPDVGYRYNKTKKIFEKISSINALHVMNPSRLRMCVREDPSSFMAGLGIDLVKKSFPIGAPLSPAQFRLPDGRPLSPGTLLQLHGVFLDKQGNAVPHFEFDSRRSKYIVYAACFMGEDGSPIASQQEILSSIGLEGWQAARGTSESTVMTCVSGSFPFAKSTASSARVVSVRNILKFEDDKIAAVTGPSTCVAEESSGTFYGIIPHIVPSASKQIYPLVYATVCEPGMTTTAGPCEIYIVHFQCPKGIMVPFLNKDIYIDAQPDAMDTSRSPHSPIVQSFMYNVFNGAPQALLRDQRVLIEPSDLCNSTISIQSMNIALADAPLPFRIMQIASLAMSGIPTARVASLDPDDTEAMRVHDVAAWMDQRGVVASAAVEALSSAVTESISKQFDSDDAFNSLMVYLDRCAPKCIDKAGGYKSVIETLERVLNTQPLSLFMTVDIELQWANFKMQSKRQGTASQPSIRIRLPLLLDLFKDGFQKHARK